jgi:methionine synthase I (cobalamin-dependent)
VQPRIEQLVATGVVVTDGGFGTQLQARGLPVGACPDQWNLAEPQKVEEVARAYVEAGSQIILTNTFGSNRCILGRHGLADQAAEINRAGVAVARRAALGRARVFGSIGPSGVMLLMGDISASQLRAAFAEQAQALAEAGADGLVVESMSDLDEARLAVEAACQTGLPVVASMVFGSDKAAFRTMMGNTPEQAADALASAGAEVIGANCGQGIEAFIPICRRLRDATERPIWIKPNAGLPELVAGRTVYRQTPEQFADKVPALIDSGAAFLGGCCGTTPEFIRAVVKRVRP